LHTDEYIEKSLIIEKNSDAVTLFGQMDGNLKYVEQFFDVQIVARGNEIIIQGVPGDVKRVNKLFEELIEIIEEGKLLSSQDIKYAVKMAYEQNGSHVDDFYDDIILVTFKGKKIRPKTLGQKRYIEAMRNNDIVFAIGPAGTGKTYLAMVMAVANLQKNKVSRIILTRPAIEAGENLGFLPGDLQEKVDPYLRPLYDALYDILGVDKVQEYLERDIIEIAPLAYMRGRTLDDSFVILDEAQNTTRNQMKMFLTRLGHQARAAVTGDITQIDLPSGQSSGLKEVQSILNNIEGLDFIYLDKSDVVRHALVQKIIKAYETHEND